MFITLSQQAYDKRIEKSLNKSQNCTKEKLKYLFLKCMRRVSLVNDVFEASKFSVQVLKLSEIYVKSSFQKG